MLFTELKLITPLLEALQKEGYTTPTPIQERAIPQILQRRDLLGCAQTGTGKTAAFTLPVLQLLEEDRKSNPLSKIKVLILTPTRELAIQIGDSIAAYGRHLPFKHAVIFGGVSQHHQVNAIRSGLDILVATPGRLLDLMQQRILSLKDIQYFILDEADRMLDMGFVQDVRRIISVLPEKKQTLFFSATMPPEIKQLADILLHNPVKVEVNPVSSTAELVQQSVYYVEKTNKKALLVHLLQDTSIKRVLVFTQMKFAADRLANQLKKAGIPTEAIHGNKSQNARQRALEQFKNNKTRVLVATDIAARGIDIDDLTHVVNYELPNVPETYVHRIGRTGRAGASGQAISFCEWGEKSFLKDIEKLIKQSIPVVKDHPFDVPTMHNMTVSNKPGTQSSSGGGRGRRGVFTQRSF